MTSSPAAATLARRGIVAAAALGAAAVARPAQGQVQLESGATTIGLSGRFQVQAISGSCSDYDSSAPPSTLCSEDVPALDMFIRRARLTLDVTFNEWISGRFEPDFAEVDGVTLKDAYGLLDLRPGDDRLEARIKIGHFKRPFDGFQMTSSTQILTIERDLDIPGVSGTTALSLDELTTRNHLSDRDIGVMVDGATAGDRFHFWLGVFNGSSDTDNGDLDTEKQFIGRARYGFDLGEHPLAVSGAVAVTDIPYLGADEALDARYFAAFELFAEVGGWGGGPHVQTGIVFGKNALENELGEAPDLAVGDPLASMLTWQAIGSYKLDVGDAFFIEAIEPLIRITVADPNTDIDSNTVFGFTPGVQIFFGGRNKLALNYDFVSFGGDGVDSESSFKAQYQFHF